MADHAGESFMDKVKNALGMGTEHRDAVEAPTHDEEGWAGVPEALEEDLDVANRPAGPDYGHREHAGTHATQPMRETVGDVTNRPAGPDYGHREHSPTPTDEPMRDPVPPEAASDTEFEVGLDRESLAGTGASKTGTGLDYDFERGDVVDEQVEPDRRDLGI